MTGGTDVWSLTDDYAMDVWALAQERREQRGMSRIDAALVDGTYGVQYQHGALVPVGIYSPLTPPQPSHIGHAIGLGLSVTFLFAGTVIGLITPALSGGTLVGMALICIGAAGVGRIVHNIRRTES
jgi:hypothetical protein